MAPKIRRGILGVRSQDLLTVEERMARLRSCAPAVTAVAVPSSAASLSLPGHVRAPPPPAVVAASSFGVSAAPAAPLRSDASVVKYARRGSASTAVDALHHEGLDVLLDTLVTDRFAASARGNSAACNRTWAGFHSSVFGGSVPVTPLSAQLITAVAALFKRGNYRSFSNYSSAIKAFHIEEGHAWTSLLARTMGWCARSVARGLGPARQSQPLPLHRLVGLVAVKTPLSLQGGVLCGV